MGLATDDVLANRYRIIKKIGSGGMADVFQGVDHVLKREVAVKVLTAQSAEVSRRFLIEAQSMARLNHPNIVAVYDVGVDRHLSYIILEYVRGTLMRDIDRSTISLEEAINLIVQLLEALQYAHAQGVIHRDIKPGNILLRSDKTLKVMDFGLARRITDVSDLTRSSEILGTIAYSPPERFLGKSGDRTGDLYSVGVLLYELLCGKLPFDDRSDDLVAIMFSHVHDCPKSPRRINPSIPSSLDRIIMRLLDREPACRYPDAPSVIAALRQAQVFVRSNSAAKKFKAVPISQLDASAEPQSEASPQRPHPRDVHVVDARKKESIKSALESMVAGIRCGLQSDCKRAHHHYAAAVGMLMPSSRSSEEEQR